MAWHLGADALLATLERLERLVDSHLAASMAIYLATFVAGSLLGLPLVTLYCLAAGYLFGTAFGLGLALAGGISGAVVTFLVARWLGGSRMRNWVLRGRGARYLKILERDAFYWLVVLRVLPVAPFFIVNAAAGLTAVGTGRYLLATSLGMVPTSLVYVAAGAGLNSLLEARDLAGPGILMQPEILLPLLGLIALVGITLWFRRGLPAPD